MAAGCSRTSTSSPRPGPKTRRWCGTSTSLPIRPAGSSLTSGQCVTTLPFPPSRSSPGRRASPRSTAASSAFARSTSTPAASKTTAFSPLPMARHSTSPDSYQTTARSPLPGGRWHSAARTITPAPSRSLTASFRSPATTSRLAARRRSSKVSSIPAVLPGSRPARSPVRAA